MTTDNKPTACPNCGALAGSPWCSHSFHVKPTGEKEPKPIAMRNGIELFGFEVKQEDGHSYHTGFYRCADVDALLAAERAAHAELEDYTARLLDRVTGGRISKPFTGLNDVETEAQESFTRDLIAEHAAALAAKDAEIARLTKMIREHEEE